jgi:hypothetical protein
MTPGTKAPLCTLETGFLLACAGCFFYFGFGFLLFPTTFCAAVDIELTSPTAITDVRATYGGFEIGLALFVCFCARQPALHRTGLLVIACTVGGFGAGRLFGIILDGSTVPLMVGFTILETVVTFFSLFLFFRLKKAKMTTD